MAITWGSGGIAVMGAGQGVGPKKLFIVHMTWSTGCQTSPPPRGGFSQHLPIFAWNMPVFSQAQYLHVGMMGVHSHGSVPHFSQFNVRDWNSGRGLTFLLNNLCIFGLELLVTKVAWEDSRNEISLMVLFHKLFLGYPMVWVSFQCIEKKWAKFEFWDFSKKSFSYFLTFLASNYDSNR